MPLSEDQIAELLGETKTTTAVSADAIDFAERKHPLACCEVCPLLPKKYVPSHLPLDAKVALVSRSPGPNDSKAPFTGPSGTVVDYLLERHGYSRENVILTNIVSCQTDAPSRGAIEACKPRLTDELSNVTTIIAGGAEAVKEFTDKQSVASARGFVNYDEHGRRIIAANNPALVFKDSDSFPQVKLDFRLALDPIPEPTFPEVEVIEEPNVARNILREWDRSLTGDIATDLEWRGHTIVCAGFCTDDDGKHSTVFGQRVIADPECFGLIKRLYESKEIRSTWHNGESDTTVLWHNGIGARIDEDTFLISYALDEEPGRHSLDYLLQTNLGWPNYEPESVKHFKKTGRFDYYGTEPDNLAQAESELYLYNGWDSAGTKQLANLLVPRAQAEDVFDKPYKSILLPAAFAFRNIQIRGLRFDAVESANILEEFVLPALRDLTEQMREISGNPELNPRGHEQMAVQYYDIWGLKHRLKNKAKKKFTRSSGKEVREEIEGGRFTCKPGFTETIKSFGEIHQRFSRIERQRANYFQPLIERADKNGYIHPRFNICGTVTGRPSSSRPNFQNITREGVEGIPSIRKLFIPSDGHVLISADYSQAELRTMAWLSQDPELLGIYSDNTRSLHKERAAAFYGENYTKEEYVKSKNINFGVSYWQSARTFAQMYHMPEPEAQAYIDSWWRTFPKLRLWTKEVAKQTHSGEVVSSHGYHRRFHLITSDNINEIERAGINFLPQNIAVVFTLHSCVELDQMGIPMVNMVHDSILCDAPIADQREVAITVKEVMESQAKKLLDWDLPFLVDVSIGDRWSDVKEVTL